MSLSRAAFLSTAAPLHAQHVSWRATAVTQRRSQHPRQVIGRRAATVRAAFKEDFLTGPSSPPRPRPLYQVILFSASTGLLWYGYYKYCIEEELLRETGHGLGGIGTLAPFMAGISGPLYAPTGGPAEALALAGVAWIVAIQFTLYRRINALMLERHGYEPLVPWWVVIPGFNLVAGLRSVHFLSVSWGFKPDEDPLVNVFPFLGVSELGMVQLVTKPSLWLNLKK